MKPTQRRVTIAAVAIAVVAGGCSPAVRSEAEHLPGQLEQITLPKIPIKPRVPGGDVPISHPDEIPLPKPGNPGVGVPYTFLQKQLDNYMRELEDGTWLEKRIKGAACSAMRDMMGDPDDKQAWENRISSHLPSLAGKAPQWLADRIVDNLASRIAATNSDYYVVSLAACRS